MILDFFNDCPHKCYLVGGALRNWCWGKYVDDLDIVVDTADVKVVEDWAKRFCDEIGGSFVVLDGARGIFRAASKWWHFDICTRRGSSMWEDLLNRDFTVNSLAWSWQDGEFLAVDHVYEDLAFKYLRAVSGDSIKNDPLRIFRALRFVCKYGVRIEEGLFKDMVESVPLLHNVAWERIWEEMHTILEQKIGESWELWRRSGVLNFFQIDDGEEGFHFIRLIEEADEAGWDFLPGSAEKLQLWLHEKIEGGWCRLSILKLFFLLHDFWKRGGGKNKLPSYVYSSLLKLAKNKVGDLLDRGGSLEDWHELLYGSKNFPLEALAAYFQSICREGKYFSESKGRGNLYLDRLVSDYLEAGPLSNPILPVSGKELCEELNLEPGAKIGYLLKELRIAGLRRKFSRGEALSFARDLIEGL